VANGMFKNYFHFLPWCRHSRQMELRREAFLLVRLKKSNDEN
jgi:hypothetical protein